MYAEEEEAHVSHTHRIAVPLHLKTEGISLHAFKGLVGQFVWNFVARHETFSEFQRLYL